MSRRDDRDRDRDRERDRDRNSDSRRNRSRFDREPSPKRSRRDGKPVTERAPINTDVDRGHTDRDHRHRRRLQDALPLEAPSAPESKADTVDVSKEPDKKSEPKSNGHPDVTKHSTATTEVPRSRSYFQHDERGNAGQVGRNFGRRATTERRSWNDSKDQNNERSVKKATYDTQQKEEKPKSKEDGNGVWRHDGFFEMESDPTLPPPPPLPPGAARKRPAFRETKNPVESENSEKAAEEPSKSSFPDRTALESERREERRRDHRNFRRPENPSAGDRRPYRGEARRDGFSSRERYGGGSGSNNNGRERFGRQGGNHSGSTFAEKWKHDMYDEANRSPTPKNEEDQIAKVEALLAS